MQRRRKVLSTFRKRRAPVTSLEHKGTTRKSGTTIRFKPDPVIFSVTNFSFETLSERLKEAAFLLKGFRINLIDERSEKIKEVYQYNDGIESFVSYLNEEKDTLHPVVSFEGSYKDIEADFAFQFNDGFAENILSFVNNVRTKDGGTHESGAKTAITRIFNDYARRAQLIKEKDKTWKETIFVKDSPQ